MSPLNIPAAPELVTVTVDGSEMKLPKGKNLLQALLDAGIYVPHYCYHPALSVAGNCRLCLVEIVGRPKPEVSCNMVVSDGLNINVSSELVDSCRKGMMEFLLVNHPLDCPICDRGGECMLQRYSMEYGTGTTRVADVRRRFQKPQFDPLIDIERNRCIMCTRCVRFCDEVSGEHTLGVFGHGNRNYIGTFGNGPVSDPFSGNVIDLCPVGCLTSKPFRFQARGWDEALGRAAAAIRAAEADQVAILAGERSSNEEAFLLARLARAVIGTPYIDWRSRFVSEEAAQAAGLALRASDGDFDLLEKKAYGATLMINADLLGSAPDIALRIKEAARHGRTRVGLLDSRLDKWFLAQAGPAFVEAPEVLAGIVETLAEAIAKGREAANAPAGYESLFKLLAENEQGLIVLGLDNAGGLLNPALVPAALKLMQALGQKWHFLPVTAARNAKGVFGSGAQSDRLPGGSLDDARAREKNTDIWGETTLPEGACVAAPEILHRAARGEFKVLLLHRCDELVTNPQRDLVEKALKATETVIAVDIFPSWITELATIVLPGSLFYESNGSMTDIDGTLRRMGQACRPAGKAQEEWRILDSLAIRLGDQKRYGSAQEIFSDLQRAWDVPRPFRFEDITPDNPGEETPQRHHYFGTRPLINYKLSWGERPEAHAGVELKRPDGAMTLVWSMHSQGGDHLGGRSTEFDALRPRPCLEIHPSDAACEGLAEGDWVVIKGGSLQPSQIRLNENMTPGVAFGSANVLGLRLEKSAEALPAIRLEKTEAPASSGGQAPEEVEVSR